MARKKQRQNTPKTAIYRSWKYL